MYGIGSSDLYLLVCNYRQTIEAPNHLRAIPVTVPEDMLYLLPQVRLYLSRHSSTSLTPLSHPSYSLFAAPPLPSFDRLYELVIIARNADPQVSRTPSLPCRRAFIAETFKERTRGLDNRKLHAFSFAHPYLYIEHAATRLGRRRVVIGFSGRVRKWWPEASGTLICEQEAPVP